VIEKDEFSFSVNCGGLNRITLKLSVHADKVNQSLKDRLESTTSQLNKPDPVYESQLPPHYSGKGFIKPRENTGYA
jgi:hypothetical protein